MDRTGPRKLSSTTFPSSNAPKRTNPRTHSRILRTMPEGILSKPISQRRLHSQDVLSFYDSSNTYGTMHDHCASHPTSKYEAIRHDHKFARLLSTRGSRSRQVAIRIWHRDWKASPIYATHGCAPTHMLLMPWGPICLGHKHIWLHQYDWWWGQWLQLTSQCPWVSPRQPWSSPRGIQFQLTGRTRPRQMRQLWPGDDVSTWIHDLHDINPHVTTRWTTSFKELPITVRYLRTAHATELPLYLSSNASWRIPNTIKQSILLPFHSFPNPLKLSSSHRPIFSYHDPIDSFSSWNIPNNNSRVTQPQSVPR